LGGKRNKLSDADSTRIGGKENFLNVRWERDLPRLFTFNASVKHENVSKASMKSAALISKELEYRHSHNSSLLRYPDWSDIGASDLNQFYLSRRLSKTEAEIVSFKKV
jgi:hypothetical protein